MDDTTREQLARALHDRQRRIAETWYDAIAHTGFVPLSSAEVRQQLFDMTGQVIALLLAEPFEAGQAEQVGKALVGLHYTKPETLGRTQGLFARELVRDLPPEHTFAIVSRVGSLLEGLAVGFGREAGQILLREQESIRVALLSELKAAERQLREAHEHLEEQVEKRTRELQASEQKYRELLEEIDAVIVTLNREGAITYASPAIVRLFGGQLTDSTDKPFHEYIYPADQPLALQQFARVAAGEASTSEFRVIDRQGALRWVHASTRPVLADGRVVAAHSVVTDITERKQAEDALRESEERWRTLLDNSPDPVLTLDRQGRVLFVNYVRPESGLTLRDVLGQSALDRTLPDQLEAAMTVLDRIFERGESIVMEVAVPRPDGSRVWYACHAGPVQQDGQTAALVVARDITERKAIEADLQESEERWRSLVTYAPDSVLTVGADGRIQFVNHMPAESGFSPGDMLGRRISEFVVPEHGETVESALKQVFGTGESVVYESAVQRPNGTRIWYAAHMGPMWKDNRVVAAMLIARDITERRRIEEMKDHLLRDVAHELRTPLTRAQVSLEMMLESIARRPVDANGAAKYGQTALDNIQRLTTTVRGILDLGRLEAGVGAFGHETIRLPELIAAAARDMEARASEKGLRLVLRVEDALPPLQGDREQLGRVVHNLLDNACKFAQAGEIVASARMEGGEIVVSVRDRGCGILPENLERVFDRFFREDTGTDGVGVGLPMCRMIIRAHGGRIWAESAGRGQGATFRFALPVPSRGEREALGPEEGQRSE